MSLSLDKFVLGAANYIFPRVEIHHPIPSNIPRSLPPFELRDVNMNSAIQPIFIPRLEHPATTFAIACLTISVLALATVWKSHASVPQERTKEQRPRPTLRRAIDDVLLDSKRLPDPPVVIEPPQPSLTKLVSKCAFVSQSLRSLDQEGDLRFTIASLLSELSMTMTTLCRIQHATHGDADDQDDSVALLETLTAGLEVTLSILATEISSGRDRANNRVFVEILQQLRDQRPTLTFLLECTEKYASAGCQVYDAADF